MPAAPWELRAAPGDADQEAAYTGCAEHHANPVEHHQPSCDARPLGRQLDAEWDDGNSYCAEGKVDVKHPAPSGMLAKQTTNQWCNNGTDCPRDASEGNVHRALPHGHNIGKDSIVQRQASTTANALKRSASKQGGEIMGDAADYGSEGKECHREEEQRASPKVIGEGDNDRLEQGAGQEIG